MSELQNTFNSVAGRFCGMKRKQGREERKEWPAQEQVRHRFLKKQDKGTPEQQKFLTE
jgi:hypothetical protein